VDGLEGTFTAKYATEGHGRKIRQKKRVSICHGLTRNFTEGRIAIKRAGK
jgi:hypothetical protein